MPRPITPPIDRFMAKVRKTDSCWLWTGTTGGTGARYGYFRPGTKSSDPKVPAHRWLWEYTNGPIPEGLELDHVKERGCTSKLCVNPEHLEPVTHVENRKRGRLDFCPAGHDLSVSENCRWDSQGRRRGCKVCYNESARVRMKARYYETKDD